MEIGQMNFKVLAFWMPVKPPNTVATPTQQVNVKATEGKCDFLRSPDAIAGKITQPGAGRGTGVNVYTHGEMLPAHGYRNCVKFKHPGR